jgi:hypothetical protein
MHVFLHLFTYIHIKNFEGRIRHEPVVRPQMTVTDPRMTLEPLMTISRHNRSILGATAGTSNFNDRNRSADEGSYFSHVTLSPDTCLPACDRLHFTNLNTLASNPTAVACLTSTETAASQPFRLAIYFAPCSSSRPRSSSRPPNAPASCDLCQQHRGGEGWDEQACRGSCAHLVTVAAVSELRMRWEERPEANPTCFKRQHKHVRSSMGAKALAFTHARSKL